MESNPRWRPERVCGRNARGGTAARRNRPGCTSGALPPRRPMAASVDFKTYVDQACRAADEFVNIYYETMDKRRRALTRLYLDKATLVWNGNAVSGQEELNKFFEMLPSSEFQVNVLDCQPVHGEPNPSSFNRTRPEPSNPWHSCQCSRVTEGSILQQ
ncbi:NTF2-related export protein 2 isoform X2 [Neopelma chrysocephalum]|uniref:NTF2-related export protein 2 isoform X2 n=1 Tax=Neopelma chrysocephalum TaxID=114329 RepID=UPI000FCD450C|nr:NTF2-related export protein 2 isoform X2 [Neopelma chrysocephalum]